MTSAPPRSAALSVPKAEQQLFHLNRLKKIQSFSSSPFLFFGDSTYPAQRSAGAWWGRAPWCPPKASSWSWNPHLEAAAATWRPCLQTAAAHGCTRHTGTPGKAEDMQTHCTYVQKVDFTSWLLLGNGWLRKRNNWLCSCCRSYPVEGNVELRQKMRDRSSQGSAELRQRSALRQALVLAA